MKPWLTMMETTPGGTGLSCLWPAQHAAYARRLAGREWPVRKKTPGSVQFLSARASLGADRIDSGTH